MNAWLMKGYFDTVPISLDESAKLDGAGTLPSLLANRPSSCSSNDCRSSTLGFLGPFGDYILSKFLLRDEVNYTVAVGLQTFISDQKSKNRLLCSRCYFDRGSNLYLILLPTKNFVSGLTAGGDKG